MYENNRICHEVDAHDAVAISTAIDARLAMGPLPEGDCDDERGAALAEVCRGWLEMLDKLGEYQAGLEAAGIDD